VFDVVSLGPDVRRPAAHKRSQRRKLAVASWSPSRDGRVYTRMEIEASPILEYAASMSAASGVRVTLTHVIGKAVAAGLREVPEFNARVVLGRVVRNQRVDVGFAVDLAEGTDLAPVTLRAVDSMSTVQIASAIGDRAERLRTGADRDFTMANAFVRWAPRLLARPALAFVSLWNGGWGRRSFGVAGFPFGAAFISNVGSVGLDEALLAPLPLARCSVYVCVGAVRERPVVVNSSVVARPTVILTATADHRIVDGVHAARLAAYLRSVLAEPSALDDVRGPARPTGSPNAARRR
jgi:pyruvate/2-oxoglutarate dehydrogenase complex dihydrolipoamide acyltransferase (E2) component